MLVVCAVEMTVHAPVVWTQTPAITMQVPRLLTIRPARIRRVLSWIAMVIAWWLWIVPENAAEARLRIVRGPATVQR